MTNRVSEFSGGAEKRKKSLCLRVFLPEFDSPENEGSYLEN